MPSDPVRFGYRLPIWDPKGTSATEWWPRLLHQLDVLPPAFESVWLADHFVPGADWMPADTDTLEAWTAACFLAASYPRLRVGHLVLANSFRHPALLAKMSSTFQFLSGGRFVLGLGAGWMEREYRAFGFDFPPTRVRLAQLDESLSIIRGLWVGARFTQTGEHYALEDAVMRPTPTPPPPILIGTGGEEVGLRLVARHADWWNASGLPVEAFRRKAAVLRARCEEIDRDPEEVLLTWQGQRVAIADSNAEAQRIADANPMAQLTLNEPALVGTPELVAEMLGEYVAAGARYFMLRFADFPSTEGFMRFAAEVAPRLDPS